MTSAAMFARDRGYIFKFQDRARWCGHVYISGFKSQITHGLTLIVVINYLILVKPLLGSS